VRISASPVGRQDRQAVTNSAWREQTVDRSDCRHL